MSRIVQLTDTHICAPGTLAYGKVDTNGLFEQAVHAIQRLPFSVDAIVMTGDLVDHGRMEEYVRLRELLTPLAGIPLYLLPGNHDDRQVLRQAFPDQPAWMEIGFCQYSIPIGSTQLIALDSIVPRKDAGVLCRERLAWLEATLQQTPDRPTILALHHPPFRTLIDGMDAIGLLDGADELQAIVDRHPQVQCLIAGHVHRSIHAQFGKARAVVAPSTAHQVALDLRPQAPMAWTLEPPGFMVHALTQEGRIVTHQASSQPFAGPFPFG